MTEKIQFISSHRPALELGDYSITIEQRVSIKNPDNTEIILLGEIPGKEHERAITENDQTNPDFTVLGLEAANVHGVNVAKPQGQNNLCRLDYFDPII